MVVMTMDVLENEQEITVAATMEQIPFISDFIEGLMSFAGFDLQKIMEVQLAAEEACTNVAKYAYPGKDGMIHIVARMAGDRLNLIIEDWGVPFDPTAHAVALSQASAEDRPYWWSGNSSHQELCGWDVLRVSRWKECSHAC